MFAGKSVLQNTNVFMMTQYDPIFIMVPIFLIQKSLKGSYQTVTQILEQGLSDYDANCFPEN